MTIACTLVPFQCYCCGVVFGVEKGLLEMRKQDNQLLHCSNGHPFRVIQDNPEADRLARIVEKQEAKIEQLEAQVQEMRADLGTSVSVGSMVEPLLNRRKVELTNRYPEG